MGNADDCDAPAAASRSVGHRQCPLHCRLGHGPDSDHPAPGEGLHHVGHRLDNRRRREAEILAAVALVPMTTGDLARQLYNKSDARLAWAAERNVGAHLQKLDSEGRVAATDGYWRAI